MWEQKLETEVARAGLARIYGNDAASVDQARDRLRALAETFRRCFPAEALDRAVVFSAPGRVEVVGNHTDHNNGKVIAAAINLDTLALAAPTPDPIVTIHSAGYDKPFVVDLADLAPRKEEQGTTEALIRGTAGGLERAGARLGGFQACVTSNVGVGSGLSSSAAFEVLVGTILNHFHNEGKIAPAEIAKAGRISENQYFDKPSGLMDQMASATGGFVAIDFADVAQPKVERVKFDPAGAGYVLVVTNTGGSHADLTPHYAAIPNEMKAVAAALGVSLLRETSRPQLLERVDHVREQVGDRAILRALHFYEENGRVDRALEALKNEKIDRFLQQVRESGRSSWTLLQNCTVPADPEQSVALGLALSETALDGHGACRVHGGGFAGTILAFVSREKLDRYTALLEAVFGDRSVSVLNVREPGATALGID